VSTCHRQKAGRERCQTEGVAEERQGGGSGSGGQTGVGSVGGSPYTSTASRLTAVALTVPHVPWECRNIPIPPGLRNQVMEVLKLKIDAGVYEQSQSSYQSHWFVVQKKNGKLRIVHDLQPLNRVTIRDAGMLPIVDDFVENLSIQYSTYFGDLMHEKYIPRAET